jgi:hypothetical protein
VWNFRNIAIDGLLAGVCPMKIDEDNEEFDHAAERMIELGNLLLNEDHNTDSWEVASGLLAGAVHFWLYSRQPCGDLHCEACGEIDTAHKRLMRLAEETQQFAEDSDYYHTAYDVNAGNA